MIFRSTWEWFWLIQESSVVYNMVHVCEKPNGQTYISDTLISLQPVSNWEDWEVTLATDSQKGSGYTDYQRLVAMQNQAKCSHHPRSRTWILWAKPIDNHHLNYYHTCLAHVVKNQRIISNTSQVKEIFFLCTKQWSPRYSELAAIASPTNIIHLSDRS